MQAVQIRGAALRLRTGYHVRHAGQPGDDQGPRFATGGRAGDPAQRWLELVFYLHGSQRLERELCALQPDSGPGGHHQIAD